MVNTGAEPLIFFVVYLAQAGHGYERVRREGSGLWVRDLRFPHAH